MTKIHVRANHQSPVLAAARALLILGQQYDQAQDEPQDQQVRGDQEERHRVQVAPGSLESHTLWQPLAPIPWLSPTCSEAGMSITAKYLPPGQTRSGGASNRSKDGGREGESRVVYRMQENKNG